MMAKYPLSNTHYIPKWDTTEIGSIPIQGKMIMVEYNISDHETLTIDDPNWKEFIKEKLAIQLSHKMFQDNFVEYTMTQDFSCGTRLVKARCFVTPNEQVRLLRTYGRI